MATRKIVVAVVLGAVLGTPGLLPAAEPMPTLFERLGITPGLQRLRDITVNRRGENPQRERTPQLKRIADPANLESEDLAIQTAAKIKEDQDLKPQKIKAIKFLAQTGCVCYPGVQEALLASLDDCDPEVRAEAAIAVCMTAGNPHDPCSKGCCNVALMQKLHEMAHMRDETGCWIEPDARVRAAAAQALEACRAKHRPTVEPVPVFRGPDEFIDTPEVPELEPFEPEVPQELPEPPADQGAAGAVPHPRLVPGSRPSRTLNTPQRSASGLMYPVAMQELLGSPAVTNRPVPPHAGAGEPGYAVIERTGFTH